MVFAVDDVLVRLAVEVEVEVEPLRCVSAAAVATRPGSRGDGPSAVP
jgi:hypothetical protein